MYLISYYMQPCGDQYLHSGRIIIMPGPLSFIWQKDGLENRINCQGGVSCSA
jgi:hypothetical protein